MGASAKKFGSRCVELNLGEDVCFLEEAETRHAEGMTRDLPVAHQPWRKDDERDTRGDGKKDPASRAGCEHVEQDGNDHHGERVAGQSQQGAECASDHGQDDERAEFTARFGESRDRVRRGQWPGGSSKAAQA